MTEAYSSSTLQTDNATKGSLEEEAAMKKVDAFVRFGSISIFLYSKSISSTNESIDDG
jgi:hypothetical protein